MILFNDFDCISLYNKGGWGSFHLTMTGTGCGICVSEIYFLNMYLSDSLYCISLSCVSVNCISLSREGGWGVVTFDGDGLRCVCE